MRNIAQALAVASVLVVALPGCGGKVQQCNELIAEINAATQLINKATSSLKEAEKAKKVHDDIDAEIKKIEAVKISDEKLKEHQKRWVDQLNKYNEGLETVTGATEAKDAAKVQKLVDDLTKIETEVEKLVGETNTYCGAS